MGWFGSRLFGSKKISSPMLSLLVSALSLSVHIVLLFLLVLHILKARIQDFRMLSVVLQPATIIGSIVWIRFRLIILSTQSISLQRLTVTRPSCKLLMFRNR
jgi:hypothetical protein